MIRLSESAMYYAVLKCVECRNYHIIVAVSQRSMIQKTLYSLMKVIDTFDLDRPECRCSSNEFLIAFENGSVIRGLPVNDTVRGHRAHLVICDDAMIDDNIKECILHPIEKMKE